MKYDQILKWLVPGIILLGLVAAGAGLFFPDGLGKPYPLTTFRGESVTVNARGLYYWDTVSLAAQMQANDLVTLVVGLPLLVVSFWLMLRGSLRGRLLLTGTLGFFLYTYLSMWVGAAFNPMFLVYVALYSLSLFAFILSMMSFDLTTLSHHFSERLPRGLFSGVFFFASAFLLFAWLGRIVPSFFPGNVPLLENSTSMFIQAMDLSMVVPLCILAGILLLRRSAWGYLLAAILVIKTFTLGIAVTVMSINMLRIGVPASPVELAIFPTIALLTIVLFILLMRNIDVNR